MLNIEGFNTELRGMPGPNRTFPITKEVLSAWEKFKPEPKGARYLNTLAEVDRINIGQFVSFAKELKAQVGEVVLAIEAVGSSTKPEVEREFGEVHDIDMRVLTSPEPGSEERSVAVSVLRDGIRGYLKRSGLPFEEENCTVEHRMVNGSTGGKPGLISYIDYDNNDPSFVAKPIDGLPLHIFISGVDNYSLDQHLQVEQKHKSTAVILFQE